MLRTPAERQRPDLPDVRIEAPAPPRATPAEWTPATVLALQRAGGGNHAIARALARSASTAERKKGGRPVKSQNTPAATGEAPEEQKHPKITKALEDVANATADVAACHQAAGALAGGAGQQDAQAQGRITKLAGEIAKFQQEVQKLDKDVGGWMSVQQVNQIANKAAAAGTKAVNAATRGKAALEAMRAGSDQAQAAPPEPKQPTPERIEASKKGFERRVADAKVLIEAARDTPISTARIAGMTIAPAGDYNVKTLVLATEIKEFSALLDAFAALKKRLSRKSRGVVPPAFEEAYEDLKADLGEPELATATKKTRVIFFGDEVEQARQDAHADLMGKVQDGKGTKAEQRTRNVEANGDRQKNNRLDDEGRLAFTGAEIPVKRGAELAPPDSTNVKTILDAFKAGASRSPLGRGAKWRRVYWNEEGYLPGRQTATRYKEYYVDPLIGEDIWGVHRLVLDTSVPGPRWYYSDNHYGTSPAGTPFHLFEP